MKIYEYFNYPKIIVDITWKATTYLPLKESFQKHWGEDLTKLDNSLEFTKEENDYKNIFERNLAVVLEYFNLGYSEKEIITALKKKEHLRLRLPVYSDTEQMCEILGINENNLIALLNTEPINNSLCFKYYYGIERQKLDIVSISRILDL
jgi:hypothetical protein